MHIRLPAYLGLPAYLVLAAPLAAQRAPLPQQRVAPPPQLQSLVVEPATPRAAARFGQSTAAGDWDGDGLAELIVGAPDEGRVHLFLQGGVPGAPTFTPWLELTSSGLVPTGGAPFMDGLGEDVATADFDGDGRAELVLGAPHTELGGVVRAGRCVVFGLHSDGTLPTWLDAPAPAYEELGTSVCTGDFDGDGALDVVASAIRAEDGGLPNNGAVYVFLAPNAQGSAQVLRIPNPHPVEDAFFGLHVATGDLDGNGVDDLVVSGVWNTSSQGVELAGRVYVWPGPLDPAQFRFVEDDAPDPLDTPRYGMHLEASGEYLLIGAPRKDVAGVVDTGLAFAYRGLDFDPLHHLIGPGGAQHPLELTGFRVALGDMYGGLDPEHIVGTLAYPGPLGPRRALWIWPGSNLGGRPQQVLPLPGAGSHWCMGLSAAPLSQGARASLLVGDPTYDGNGRINSGRVVIYY